MRTHKVMNTIFHIRLLTPEVITTSAGDVTVGGARTIYLYVYTVYMQYFWQGNHHTHGHVRCVCGSANPSDVELDNALSCLESMVVHTCVCQAQTCSILFIVRTCTHRPPPQKIYHTSHPSLPHPDSCKISAKYRR